MAAVVIDAVMISAVEVVPLTMLSKAHAEVAAIVLGVVLAAAYLATSVALAGRTPGQALLGLTVVDEATGERIPAARGVLRSLVVAVELFGAMSLLLPLAAVEVVSVAATGRSVTDRVFGTAVVAGGDG